MYPPAAIMGDLRVKASPISLSINRLTRPERNRYEFILLGTPLRWLSTVASAEREVEGERGRAAPAALNNAERGDSEVPNVSKFDRQRRVKPHRKVVSLSVCCLRTD
jgi:hypothetical protein